MPTSAADHRSLSLKRARDREHATSTSNVAKLFDVGPYDRNEISRAQIDRLRDIIDIAGLPAAAERVGVDGTTLLRACAGFGHRLAPKTAAKIRAFLAGGKGA